MAACSDTEEKPSSPKETLPLKICSENAANHEMRKNCYNELSNVSKNHETFSEQTAEKSNPDVNKLSEAEFLQLMIEASTFNKSSKQESALLKKLRIDNPITETEPSDKTKLRNNTQFSVHKNSRNCIGNNSLSLASSVSHPRTSDSRKKHSRNKDDSNTKNVLNANVLQKGIHQSQSLQDLMSSDLSKSKQKSHKAHRTHSLSSDEVTGIDPDSLTVLKKLGKKSYKQSSDNSGSSKGELNKTNSNKGNSKAFQNSGSVSITVDADTKTRSSGCKDSLPYECSMSDCVIPAANYKESISENSALISSPIEIEMEEIKSDKTSSKDDGSLCGKEVEQSRNGPTQSNSKFYVDCNDIDTTVTFPLKLVSSIDDQNNEAMGEQLKRFPLVPWPRPLQVQSFFSSLPMESSETFNSRNDKQLLTSDINGNPFARNTRPSNLASFVSSTLMDYSNGSLVSETKNRKNKRLRNSVSKGVLSENIAGHRGEEDIDTLVQFINSSDKKGKTAVKGSSSIISTKSSVLHDNERKKSFGKELKSCHKTVINSDKKELKRSNSLENMSSSNVSNVFMYETRGSAVDTLIKDSKLVNLDDSIGKNLDINSNEENKNTEINEKCKDSGTDDSSLHNSVGGSSPEVSSFAADFYSTADVSSQTIEESGFLVVKKKQRKKHPSKRSDYRWRNAQVQRKKGMMLPLAESKCGKQDSRRKSTSSVPHSEHSSADNSDLDSVHSLPVRGSVPHPTQTHPHTTPSSSSSTPQASYADIARMPISKLNSPPSIITCNTQVSPKPQAEEPEIKRTDNISGNGMSSVKRRVADSQESSSLSKESPHVSPQEKESDNSSTSDVKIRSHAKSTREINTQTEPENTVVMDNLKIESLTSKPCKKVDESSKSVCNACSLRKNNCSCPKLHPCSRQKAKNMDIPPVIMDNMPSESNACNVSFGFGIEEVLEMPPVENASALVLRQKDNEVSSVKVVCKGEKIEKREGISEISSVNSKTSNTNVDSCSKSSLTLEVVSKSNRSQDLSHKQSSHLKKVYYGTGRNISYNETKVNLKKFNHKELTSYLVNDFNTVEKESKGSKNKISSKVVYYADSSEDA